ncbi:MAG TPA: hypothetical protein VFU36_16985, partial [Jatrophihabitans sp.]|nr:hypothetical protein [Jatrophihabitans sp.]
LERKRLQSKKISKTQAVTSQIPHEMERAAVHIGPSDHVPWLDDRKIGCDVSKREAAREPCRFSGRFAETERTVTARPHRG